MNILQKIAGQVPGVVYQFRLRPDGSSCVPYASDAIREIYRLDPEDVREDASKVFANVHPDDLESHLASIRASARDMTPWQQEYRLRFDDGTVRWLYGNALPQREADGSTLWHGFITDISGRKQAEAKIENSLSLLKATLESTHDAILVVDLDGAWVLYNQQFVDLWNITYEVIVGGNDGAALSCMVDQLEDADGFMKKVRGLYATPEAHFSDIIRFKDGKIIERNTIPQYSDGKIVGRVWSFRDITERKNNEERLRYSEGYLRSIIETSPECIKIINHDGLLVQMNPSGLAMIEADGLEQVSGRPALEIIAPEYREAYARLHKQVLAGERMQMEFEVLGIKGGRRWLETHAVPMQDGCRVAHLAITRDITERKRAEASARAEQEVKASRAAVRKLVAHVEKLREEERKSIAREVHDELGQVLSVLRMNIALLKDRAGMNNAAMDDIERDMLALVDRAIKGVRSVAGNLRPALLDMGCIAAIECQCAKFAEHSGIPCSLKVMGEIADTDEQRSLALFRIVQESLANVARHAAATRVEVIIATRNGSIEVEIRDNGMGFVPGKNAGDESFGLLGMRERAISVGGELNVASKPGPGTIVTLRIPGNPAAGK